LSNTAGPPLHVLVADDDPLVLDSVCALVRQAGHDVVTADTVKAAVAALGRARFDVVVADLTLRGGNLQELLDMARGAPVAVPVVVVTGSPDENLQRRALAAGAAQLLMKPFGLRVLFEALETLGHQATAAA
jgi:DNA-binding response OmpR family regulator